MWFGCQKHHSYKKSVEKRTLTHLLLQQSQQHNPIQRQTLYPCVCPSLSYLSDIHIIQINHINPPNTNRGLGRIVLLSSPLHAVPFIPYLYTALAYQCTEGWSLSTYTDWNKSCEFIGQIQPKSDTNPFSTSNSLWILIQTRFEKRLGFMLLIDIQPIILQKWTLSVTLLVRSPLNRTSRYSSMDRG